MSYAKSIGRVGALAVALGVGLAVASTPGIAVAEPSGSPTSTTDTSSSSSQASTNDVARSSGSDGTDSSDSDAASETSPSVAESDETGDDAEDTDADEVGNVDDFDETDALDNAVDTEDTDADEVDTAGDVDADDAADNVGEAGEVDVGAEEAAGGAVGDETEPVAEDAAAAPASDDEDTALVSDPAAARADQESAGELTRGDSSDWGTSGEGAAPVSTEPDVGDDTDEPVSVVARAFTGADESDDQPVSRSVVTPADDDPATPSLVEPASELTSVSAAAVSSTAPARPLRDLVNEVVKVAAQWVVGALDSLLAAGQETNHFPLALAALAWVRREIEEAFLSPPVASQQETAQLAAAAVEAAASAMPIDTNVLVIGIDGTNLSAILDDTANENLFTLMAGGMTPNGTPIAGGTTAASTIVGHTTISLPSWTTILSGAWGETTGVINNVFYPETADEFPTTFNTLEATFGDNIQTMAIANWVGTAAISNAESLGTAGADVVQYVEDFEDDPIWTKSDDLVAELTVEAIEGTNPGCTPGPCPVPDFLFSYFVGVDNAGHEYGGGSTQYEQALRNVDENVGEIMDAVVDSGEDWTVIVLTDHGQSTTRGGMFAHGFQSPEETTPFVIGWDDGNDFRSGAINNQYSILDISPTVLDLFGAAPPPWYEGVPLADHDASTVVPADPDDLRAALKDAIAMYGYPDIVTNWNLSWRTIFATVPMVLYDFTNEIVADLETVPVLGGLLATAVQFIGDALYVATNIPARIVAMVTGVETSIFPLLPPPEPMPPLAPTPPTVLRVPVPANSA